MKLSEALMLTEAWAAEDLIKSELVRCRAQNTTMDPNDYQIVVRSAKKKVSVK